MPAQLPQDIADQNEFVAHRQEFYLLPRLWSEYRRDSREFAWKLVPFESDNRKMIPKKPGIYTFLLQPSIANHPSCSYLMYVGKADNLWRRFGDYLTREQRPTGRPKIRRFLYQYDGFIWFCFSEVPNKSLEKCEDALTTAYVPPLNSDLPATIRAPRGAFS